MALRKVNSEEKPKKDASTVESKEFSLRRLRLGQHWIAVANMYRNYPGVDSNFEQVLNGRLRRPFLRWFGMPLYFWLANQGFGLWLKDGQLAGQIYLQHRKMVTHINDIEVNRPFQRRGLSHELLALAEQQAHRHRKRYLTLAVTLTNTRAVNLYRKSGFLDQHHQYFYLSRPWWSERPAVIAPATKTEVRLVALDRLAARRNLRQFFELETRTGEPLTASVWEALYRPELPQRGHGFSFALYWGAQKKPQGHADFFDWDGRGRWRLYVDPILWGTPAERDLFETLLRQAQGYDHLGLMVGSSPHHNAARSFTRELGLIERDTERMLMIRPLTPGR